MQSFIRSRFDLIVDYSLLAARIHVYKNVVAAYLSIYHKLQLKLLPSLDQALPSQSTYDVTVIGYC